MKEINAIGELKVSEVARAFVDVEESTGGSILQRGLGDEFRRQVVVEVVKGHR